MVELIWDNKKEMLEEVNSEEFLKTKDKSNLDNQSSFDIIMTMLSMNIQTPEATELISSVYLFLGLLLLITHLFIVNVLCYKLF